MISEDIIAHRVIMNRWERKKEVDRSRWIG